MDYSALSRNAQNIALYATNYRELVEQRDWMENCLRKKIARGNFEPVPYVLAESSSMKKLVREAAKILRECDETRATADELREARMYLAEAIINDL